MKKFYTILITLLCVATLQAQTFEFSIMHVGINSSTNNHQMAFIATPSATVTDGVTADLGGGFYVPSGLTIGNFVQGNSGLPATEWSSLTLGSNANGDAYFLARIEAGSSSILLNGAGPFQLVLFDIIADPNPTSGNVIFVENGDPVFDSLFIQNYININLGSGTIDAYSQNNLSENSVDFSTLSNKDFQLVEVSIYPNPTNGIINISTEKQIDTIEVFNLLGAKVKTVKNINTIDLSNQATGMYLLKITIEGQIITKKVMLK